MTLLFFRGLLHIILIPGFLKPCILVLDFLLHLRIVFLYFCKKGIIRYRKDLYRKKAGVFAAADGDRGKKPCASEFR